MRVLVTGVSGFVGGAVAAQLATGGVADVRGAVRRVATSLPREIETVRVADLTSDTNWRGALAAVDVVVHAAARVHVMQDSAADPLAEFRRVNVVGTLNLARQAAEAGARRFLFVSSIKVNGEQTPPGHPYSANDTPGPVDPYGVSKYEAEQGLRRLALETGMEVVVVRPVLVYGPGVKGNFRAMMRWIDAGFPLPLGAVHNRRSFVALDNLVDLIGVCVRHPAAGNRTFLVSDDEDVSTTDLLRRMANALGRRSRLIPLPVPILSRVARLLGKAGVARRLLASLQVDVTETRRLLGWTPPRTLDDALQQTASHFQRAHADGRSDERSD